MGYEVAISKAWAELENISQKKNHIVRFLDDEYNIDLEKKSILSLSTNVPPKTHISILLLHYLSRKLKGLPNPTGEWISFKQLDGGQFYYSVFRKRVLEPIIKKYGDNPQGLISELTKRFKGKEVKQADASVVFDVFDGIPLFIKLWRGDEEFGAEANLLFDRSISEIFCTEDAVITAEVVASTI
ncbi:MAG TPA: DUF3786 domain-containing protein [bacterium]|nr:DUF3786 domain-containing protein [bacterium]